ncbi:hypothetical protein JOC86_003795 [Bacillus pakistanensis]|uniref:Uncharacterized protein n=1 Tax=Rossellomorea pakistanensis TaxID=992288 RepID=A0ABS2NH75_9BACI|nr:hypothetical protein [Bacillus pakistanensis]
MHIFVFSFIFLLRKRICTTFQNYAREWLICARVSNFIHKLRFRILTNKENHNRLINLLQKIRSHVQTVERNVNSLYQRYKNEKGASQSQPSTYEIAPFISFRGEIRDEFRHKRNTLFKIWFLFLYF